MIIVVIGHRECHDKEVSQWISVCWKLQKWTSGAQNGTFSKSWISINIQSKLLDFNKYTIKIIGFQ